MKYLFLVLLFFAAFLPANAYAQGNNGEIVQSILSLTQQNKPAEAKAYLTPRSHDLYDRIYNHDLSFLFPSTLQTGNEQVKNGFQYIEFKNPDEISNQKVFMAFDNVAGVTKLDLPETFRLGFGEDWPKTLNMIERSYLLARQYYGKEKSAQMMGTLFNKH